MMAKQDYILHLESFVVSCVSHIRGLCTTYHVHDARVSEVVDEDDTLAGLLLSLPLQSPSNEPLHVVLVLALPVPCHLQQHCHHTHQTSPASDRCYHFIFA